MSGKFNLHPKLACDWSDVGKTFRSSKVNLAHCVLSSTSACVVCATNCIPDLDFVRVGFTKLMDIQAYVAQNAYYSKETFIAIPQDSRAMLGIV